MQRDGAMGRGGDRRPITRVQDHDIYCATPLLAAMVTDGSPAGRRFAHELEALSQRWRRLLRALTLSCGAGLPHGGPGDVRDVEQYLALARVGRAVPYPRPRALTPEEQAEVYQRARIARDILQEHWRDSGEGVTVTGSDAERAWQTHSAELLDWVGQVQQAALRR